MCFYSVNRELLKSFRQRMNISDLHYKRTIWYRGVHFRGPECLLLGKGNEKWLESRFILNIYLEPVNLGLARLCKFLT